MTLAARLVVVPMKDPSRAKTRLGEVLDPVRRAQLAVTLFQQTLRQLARAQRLATHHFELATVTASPAIAEIARATGLAVIDEGAAGDLNAAVTLAAIWATQRGYASLAVLPGDLASPSLEDLRQLLDRRADQTVICSSLDGGTNALLVPLPSCIRFRYGPGSFQAHLHEMRGAALQPLTPALTSLRHDVDRREDLLEFSRTPMTVEP